MLSQVCDELKAIIKLEQQAGRKVVQVDKCWPQCGNINVFIDKYFSTDYAGKYDNIIFHLDTDWHNPIEMYVDKNTGDCIFCSLLKHL